MTDLAIIRDEILRSLQQLGIAENIQLFHFGSDTGGNDCDDYILSVDGKWQLIHVERGQKRLVFESSDMNDFVYHIIEQQAWSKAYQLCDESADAKLNQDVDKRRCWHQHQRRLLTELNPEWGQRFGKQLDITLKNKPYDDDKNKRLALLQQLELEGHDYHQAKQMSYQKYPKPG